MNILEIILGQIPEAIYFALFMIVTKELKSKRTLFVLLMILEYMLLKHTFVYSIWFHVLYFILSFIIMKMLYKDKCNVTDVFTLGIASIILILVSIFSYFIVFGNIVIGAILNRVLIFMILFIFRNKLCNINKLYKKLWNRGKHEYKIKSTTFRALNLVIFNTSFAIINILLVIVGLCWR